MCVCLCEDVDVIGSDSVEMICLEVINISEVLSGGVLLKNAVSLSKVFRPYPRLWKNLSFHAVMTNNVYLLFSCLTPHASRLTFLLAGGILDHMTITQYL